MYTKVEETLYDLEIILNGIFPGNIKKFQAYVSGLKSGNPENVQRTLNEIVLKSARCDRLDILTLGHKAGGNLEVKDYTDRTPAHYAASNNSLNCLEYLAIRDVDLRARDMNDQTPLCLAAQEGHMEIVKFIEDFISKNQQEELYC